jgi:Ca2+ transporting ATPase
MLRARPLLLMEASAQRVLWSQMWLKSNTIFQIAEVAALCNDAQLSLDSKSGFIRMLASLLKVLYESLVEKIGTQDPAQNQARASSAAQDCLHLASSWYEKRSHVLQLTNSPETARACLSLLEQNNQKLLVKGAPESIIDRCTRSLSEQTARRFLCPRNSLSS